MTDKPQVEQGSELNDLIAQFIHWEQASRDTIDFKKAYVDMAGDLVAGLVLSQIIYWHLPGRNGVTRLQVSRDGKMWVAKNRAEWWEEIRISPKQLDRALIILKEKDLVETGRWHFAGKITLHVRLKWDGFIPAFRASILTKGENTPKLPKGKNTPGGISTKGKNASSPKGKMLYTETTNRDYSTETTLPQSANATADAPTLPQQALANTEPGVTNVPLGNALEETPPGSAAPPSFPDAPNGFAWVASSASDEPLAHLTTGGFASQVLCKHKLRYRFWYKPSQKANPRQPCPDCLHIATDRTAQRKAVFEPKPWSNLTKAMHEATPPHLQPPRLHYGKHDADAMALHKKGYTAQDVGDYVRWAYKNDRYINGIADGGRMKTIWMGYVNDHISEWRATINGRNPDAARHGAGGRAGDAGMGAPGGDAGGKTPERLLAGLERGPDGIVRRVRDVPGDGRGHA